MYGEDAPANATGVAVAGTGDDSSTVIVRKRKEMRDRLLKRFKIKESIDRAIPDIVEEPDEIRTRTNQLKELAKEKQEIEEKIKGLENKAKKTGMPYGILKKVYDRGMAAWKGGHRPGTTQQQWAFARVNSFVTKSSGTWGGADKDLAKQVRARG
jgi:regulator of replication initiation timing